MGIGYNYTHETVELELYKNGVYQRTVDFTGFVAADDKWNSFMADAVKDGGFNLNFQFDTPAAGDSISVIRTTPEDDSHGKLYLTKVKELSRAIDVSYAVRDGNTIQSTIPGFSKLVSHYDVGTVTLNDTDDYYILNLDNACTEVKIRLACPSLFSVDDDGNIKQEKINLEVYYGNNVEGTWTKYDFDTDSGNLVLVGKSKSELNFTALLKFSEEKQCDIKIVRLTEESTNLTSNNTCNMLSYSESRELPLSYPNTALLGLRIEAGEKISGGIPNITTIIKGKIVKDIVSGVCEYSNNPANIICDLLTNKTYGLGRHFDESKIDTDSFIEFYNWCDEVIEYTDSTGTTSGKRYEINLVIDKDYRALDLLNKIVQTCRSYLVWNGDQIRIVSMKPQEDENGDIYPVQLFTAANIIDGSYTENYLGLSDVPNQVEIQYLNEDNDFEQEIITARDKFRLDETPDSKTIQLYGITRPDIARREAVYALKKAKGTLKTIEFEAYIDSILCEPGDLILFSHNSPLYGFSGHITEVGIDYIKLDRDTLPESNSGEYRFLFKNSDNDFVERTVVASAISGDTITIDTADLAKYNQWVLSWEMLDESSDELINPQEKPFIITSIARESDATVKISAEEYNASVFDSDLDIDVSDVDYSGLGGFNEKNTASQTLKSVSTSYITNIELYEYYTSNVDKQTADIQIDFAVPQDGKTYSSFDILMSKNQGEWQTIGSTTTGFFTYTGAELNQTYYFLVKPYTSNGLTNNPTEQSFVWNYSIIPDGIREIIPAVTGFSAEYASNNKDILLSWNQSSWDIVKGYYLLAKAPYDSDFNCLGSILLEDSDFNVSTYDSDVNYKQGRIVIDNSIYYSCIKNIDEDCTGITNTVYWEVIDEPKFITTSSYTYQPNYTNASHEGDYTFKIKAATRNAILSSSFNQTTFNISSLSDLTINLTPLVFGIDVEVSYAIDELLQHIEIYINNESVNADNILSEANYIGSFICDNSGILTYNFTTFDSENLDLAKQYHFYIRAKATNGKYTGWAYAAGTVSSDPEAYADIIFSSLDNSAIYERIKEQINKVDTNDYIYELGVIDSPVFDLKVDDYRREYLAYKQILIEDNTKVWSQLEYLSAGMRSLVGSVEFDPGYTLPDEWQDNIDYVVGDKVIDDNYETYECILDAPVGTELSNEDYWETYNIPVDNAQYSLITQLNDSVSTSVTSISNALDTSVLPTRYEVGVDYSEGDLFSYMEDGSIIASVFRAKSDFTSTYDNPNNDINIESYNIYNYTTSKFEILSDEISSTVGDNGSISQAIQNSNSWVFRVDSNNAISGFGLVQETGDTITISEFAVRADKFYICDPDDTSSKNYVFAALTGDEAGKIGFNDAVVLIDGDLITTGSILGNRIAANAEIIVGDGSGDGFISSQNFNASTGAGWKIDGNGNAVFYGTVSISSGGSIGGTTIPSNPSFTDTVVTNTNQLTDGAGLGSSATWSQVTGSGKPADNATCNTGALANLNTITDAYVTSISGAKIKTGTLTVGNGDANGIAGIGIYDSDGINFGGIGTMGYWDSGVAILPITNDSVILNFGESSHRWRSIKLLTTGTTSSTCSSFTVDASSYIQMYAANNTNNHLWIFTSYSELAHASKATITGGNSQIVLEEDSISVYIGGTLKKQWTI